jgi:hypothetical protein
MADDNPAIDRMLTGLQGNIVGNMNKDWASNIKIFIK